MAWTDELANKTRSLINEEENKRRKWQQSFASLSPMVEQTLYELGESIWGRTFYGRRKCKVYVKSHGWVLIERKQHNTDEELAETVLSVGITSDAERFTVYIERINRMSSSLSETCKDISENQLKGTLIRLCVGLH